MTLATALATIGHAETFKLDARDGAGEAKKVVCTVPEGGAPGGSAPSCVVEERPDPERDRRGSITPYERALLSGAKVSIEGGRTNEAGFTEDGVSLPVRFDSATDTWKFTFGYLGKPVLLDAVNLWRETMSDAGPLPASAQDRTAWRELVLDALKLDLSYGYGRTAKSLIDDSRSTDDRSTFRVNAKYELPLDSLWAHIRDVGRKPGQ
jgi:hypothetical protein